MIFDLCYIIFMKLSNEFLSLKEILHDAITNIKKNTAHNYCLHSILCEVVVDV